MEIKDRYKKRERPQITSFEEYFCRKQAGRRVRTCPYYDTEVCKFTCEYAENLADNMQDDQGLEGDLN